MIWTVAARGSDGDPEREAAAVRLGTLYHGRYQAGSLAWPLIPGDPAIMLSRATLRSTIRQSPRLPTA